MVYVFLLRAVSVIFRLLFSFRVEGRQYLQDYKTNGRPFVVCANHRNILDPVFVVMAWGWGKKMTIMGKAELFRNPVLAWLFRQVGAFPVERGKGDRGAIEKAVADIKTGRGMLIFPEGTRGAYDTMAKMKSGAFMIAAQTGADIVPVRVIYPTKSKKMEFFGPVVVKIGRPLTAEDLQLEGGSKEMLRRAKNLTARAMDGLLDEYCRSTGYQPLTAPRPERTVTGDENN